MTNECCTKSAILATIAVAIFTWGFDFAMHGYIFEPLYVAHASLFRPMAEMQTLWPICIVYHIAMAALVAGAYYCWRSKLPCTTPMETSNVYCLHKSLCFGGWVGLLLGIPQLTTYMWLPIHIDLALAWGGSELIKWCLAGLLLAKIYQCSTKK